MLGAPINLAYACMLLFGGAFLCLLLEAAGVPEGFRKSGKRPHIATLAFLFSGGTGVFFLTANTLGVTEVAICLTALNIMLSTVLAIPQMRHINRERGEGYALLLAAFVMMLVLCIVNDILLFLVSACLWLMIMVALTTFRGSRNLTSQTSANLLVGSLFFFILLALCATLAYWACGSTQFSDVASAAASNNPAAKITWSLLWIATLFFVGGAPFNWFHIGYLDQAPSFASVVLATGSFLGGTTILLRLAQASQNAGMLEGPLLPILLFFGFTSLIVPSLMALDQQRIGRMCMYMLMTQPGLLLIAILSAPPTTPSFNLYVLLYENMAITIPGVIGGLSFWKHSSNADKTWEDYAGAGRKHPLTALAWLALLASITGIPGTMGFSIRVNMVQNAFAQNQIWTAALIGLALVLGAVPVTRLGVFLFAKPTRYELTRKHQPRQSFLIIACGIVVVFGGLFPSLMVQLFQQR